MGLSLTIGNLGMELIWILSHAHPHSTCPSYTSGFNPFLIIWSLFLVSAQASPFSLRTWLLLKGWDRSPPPLPFSPPPPAPQHQGHAEVPGVCRVLQTLVQLCLPTGHRPSKNGAAIPVVSSTQGGFPNGQRSLWLSSKCGRLNTPTLTLPSPHILLNNSNINQWYKPTKMKKTREALAAYE